MTRSYTVALCGGSPGGGSSKHIPFDWSGPGQA
jgi:hypothetical protein